MADITDIALAQRGRLGNRVTLCPSKRAASSAPRGRCMAIVVSEPSPLTYAKDSPTNHDSGESGWLDAMNWPVPEWYRRPAERTPTFEALFARQLRTRYLELEGDFRSIVGN